MALLPCNFYMFSELGMTASCWELYSSASLANCGSHFHPYKGLHPIFCKRFGHLCRWWQSAPLASHPLSTSALHHLTSLPHLIVYKAVHKVLINSLLNWVPSLKYLIVSTYTKSPNMVCILYRSEENDKKTNPVCFQNNVANIFWTTEWWVQ